MKRLLFLCSKNQWRSPTAEQVFSEAGFDCMSAGVSRDAEQPVTPEFIEWADLIFVMEQNHKKKLTARFRDHLRGKRVVCLGIPDNYRYMDPALVKLLKMKLAPYVNGA